MNTKQTWVIDVHSTIDLITNSSSELFIIGSDQEVGIVREMITTMAQTFKEDSTFDPFLTWFSRDIGILDINWDPPKRATTSYIKTSSIVDKVSSNKLMSAMQNWIRRKTYTEEDKIVPFSTFETDYSFSDKQVIQLVSADEVVGLQQPSRILAHKQGVFGTTKHQLHISQISTCKRSFTVAEIITPGPPKFFIIA